VPAAAIPLVADREIDRLCCQPMNPA